MIPPDIKRDEVPEPSPIGSKGGRRMAKPTRRPLPPMYDFADLLASVPLKERALRSVLKVMGYTAGQGRGKLLFMLQQVGEI